jgi:soluble lytic murein transglycosylase-like protein
MKLPDDITKYIQEAALAATLPISIVRGIVCQESRGIPTATRYEDDFYEEYTEPMSLSADEEKKRATSWGLMQIMGQTARERGFKGKFEELLDPQVGLYWGCRQLSVFHARYFKRYGWDGVIAAYNAGSPRKRKDGRWVNYGYVGFVLKYAAEK